MVNVTHFHILLMVDQSRFNEEHFNLCCQTVLFLTILKQLLCLEMLCCLRYTSNSLQKGKKKKKKKTKKTAKKVNSSQVAVKTENKDVAATQELVIKEKVEVVQEPDEHNDEEEIPQLVPMQITTLAELKVILKYRETYISVKTKYYELCKSLIVPYGITSFNRLQVN